MTTTQDLSLLFPGAEPGRMYTFSIIAKLGELESPPATTTLLIEEVAEEIPEWEDDGTDFENPGDGNWNGENDNNNNGNNGNGNNNNGNNGNGNNGNNNNNGNGNGNDSNNGTNGDGTSGTPPDSGSPGDDGTTGTDTSTDPPAVSDGTTDDGTP